MDIEDINDNLPPNTKRRIMEIDGMDPNVPRITNNDGGSQSDIPYRFDLIDAPALFAMSKVLAEGAKKYGEENWRLIPVKDHLNHLIAHTYAYLAGDISDEHLSHILCRATFALGVQLSEPNIEHDILRTKNA